MRNNLIDKKKEIRKNQYAVRKKLFTTVKKVFNKSLFDDFFKKINFQSINIISSFISINSEINTSELNNYILNKNKKLCLPVVLNKDNHLVFRQFTSNQDMVEGFKKIKEPSRRNEILFQNL